MDSATLECVTIDHEMLNNFHKWWYNSGLWRIVTYRGVNAYKWVGDLWNYGEIIHERKPTLVVEFGSAYGGSALFFADSLSRAHATGRGLWRVLSVDVDVLQNQAKNAEGVEVLCGSSTDPATLRRIADLRKELPGPLFAILDSDHHKDHVLAELKAMRTLTRAGDYVVVEDGNVNGNPVAPEFGPGPGEALLEYEVVHPFDYAHDIAREYRFGFTFAPNGYLVRQDSDAGWTP